MIDQPLVEEKIFRRNDVVLSSRFEEFMVKNIKVKA